MADFPGSVWSGYTFVDGSTPWTADKCHGYRDEIIAIEEFLIDTGRTANTVFAGPASGAAAAASFRALVSADIVGAASADPGAAEAVLKTNSTGEVKVEVAYFAEYLYHKADTDTYVRFQADQITLRAGGADMIDIVEAATNYVNFADGLVFVNDTSNAGMTRGLTLNQGSADDEILAFKSSDVAHGVTDFAETDTYGYINKANPDTAGLRLWGFTEAGLAIRLLGFITNDITTQNSSAAAAVQISVNKKSGTGSGNVNGSQNVFAVQAKLSGVQRNLMIVAADGDVYLDTAANENAWDEYDDMGLLHGFRASLVPDGHEIQQRFGQWIDYARPILESTGVIRYNPDGHHFVATKKLQMLTIDAVRQLYEKIQRLEAEMIDFRRSDGNRQSGQGFCPTSSG